MADPYLSSAWNCRRIQEYRIINQKDEKLLTGGMLVIIQQRLLKLITYTNWILLTMSLIIGLLLTSFEFTMGMLCGGLIVTVNFHLLYRTLRKSLSPSHLSSYQTVLAKYYIRFLISGIIIFILISQQYVNPLGLFIGLSVVVASIMLATMVEFKNLFLKEAV